MRILFLSNADASHPTITGGSIKHEYVISVWDKKCDISTRILDNSYIIVGQFYQHLRQQKVDFTTQLFPYLAILPYKFRLIYHIIMSVFLGIFISSKIDVIYTDYVPACFFPAIIIKLFTGKKLVITVQLIDMHRETIATHVMNQLLFFVDLLLVSNLEYIKRLHNNNTHLTGYAISSIFKPLPDNKDEYDLCFIGTVDDNRKGIREFVTTARKLYEEGLIKLALIITQSAKLTYLNSLKLNSKLFIVKQNLSQEEVNKHLNKSKVFLFPSQAESYGLVIGEALKTGTPAVISNIPELKIWTHLAFSTNNYFKTTKFILLNYSKIKENLGNYIKNHSLFKQTWDDIAIIESNYIKKMVL